MQPKSVAAVLALLVGLVIWGSGCERAPVTGEEKPANSALRQSASSTTNASATPADMVRIVGGQFQMGDSTQVDATPHLVSVSAFFMDRTLVTQEQYEKAMGDNPSRWKGAGNPVEQVRW